MEIVGNHMTPWRDHMETMGTDLKTMGIGTTTIGNHMERIKKPCTNRWKPCGKYMKSYESLKKTYGNHGRWHNNVKKPYRNNKMEYSKSVNQVQTNSDQWTISPRLMREPDTTPQTDAIHTKNATTTSAKTLAGLTGHASDDTLPTLPREVELRRHL